MQQPFLSILCGVTFAMSPVVCFGAQTIILDFGSLSAPAFGSTETEIRYTSVAQDINATLTTSSTFAAQTPSNHGSVTGSASGAEGDVRVNMTAALNSTVSNIQNSSIFTLSLWDATQGDGFSTAYSNPIDDYVWSLIFYDVDAGNPDPVGVNAGVYTYDYLRLLSPGDYRVTNNSNLQIDSLADGSVSFSGINTGAVAGQDGLSTLTVPQRRATVAYDLTNRSSVQFEYAALRANSDPNDPNLGNNFGSGRNLLVDGGELSTELGNGITTGTVVGVPEPRGLSLLCLATLAFMLRRKRI